MDIVAQWAPTIFTLFIWLVIFLCRNWLIAKIKSRVEHDFNSKLETLKSELRSREAEIFTLRDAVLTGRNQRQALVDIGLLQNIFIIYSQADMSPPLSSIKVKSFFFART